MNKVELKVKGMHCTGCSNRLEKVLNKLDGVKSASVSFETGKAIVEYEEISLESIKEAIVDSGFEVEGE